LAHFDVLTKLTLPGDLEESLTEYTDDDEIESEMEDASSVRESEKSPFRRLIERKEYDLENRS